MKIAWIFPQHKRCGISLYSHAYVQALQKHMDITCVDPEAACGKPRAMQAIAEQCSLVHVQYETSFFMRGRRDWYPNLCRSIACPIVVTLHEVYDQFPGVYPRGSISGSFPLGTIKRFIHDYRHPIITALEKHTRAQFYARTITVHWTFQKEILIRKGIPAEAVAIVPFPVGAIPGDADGVWREASPLRMAATGFINESYDYDLLLDTLALCEMPWTFTWIGGIRRSEDRKTLDRLEERIRRRRWTKRFTITGWVSDAQRAALLSQAHLYVALFKYKSSSESLSTALSAGKMIVATPGDLTREMTRRSPVVLLAENSARQCADAIGRLAGDAALRARIAEAAADFADRYSRERCARQLTLEYERVLGA